MLQRLEYQQSPPRYEYRLTDKGRAFWDGLAAMFGWGSDWMWPVGDAPTVVMKDRDSGAEVRPRVVDENTGQPLDVRRVRLALATSKRDRR